MGAAVGPGTSFSILDKFLFFSIDHAHIAKRKATNIAQINIISKSVDSRKRKNCLGTTKFSHHHTWKLYYLGHCVITNHTNNHYIINKLKLDMHLHTCLSPNIYNDWPHEYTIMFNLVIIRPNKTQELIIS